jgi:hypothetical protein
MQSTPVSLNRLYVQTMNTLRKRWLTFIIEFTIAKPSNTLVITLLVFTLHRWLISLGSKQDTSGYLPLSAVLHTVVLAASNGTYTVQNSQQSPLTC